MRGPALLFLGAIVAAPWLPAATYLPAALEGISFAIGQYITIRRQVLRPMVHAWFVCVFFIVVTIAVSRTVLTGGLVVLFFPLSGACAGFPTKLVRLCVAFMATLSIGAALLTYNSSAVRSGTRDADHVRGGAGRRRGGHRGLAKRCGTTGPRPYGADATRKGVGRCERWSNRPAAPRAVDSVPCGAAACWRNE
jgi:hypothetical protein